MLPLPILAALLFCPPSSAQSADAREQVRAKALAAFESAAPVPPELRRAAQSLAGAPELRAAVDEIAALERGPDASDKADVDDLNRRVDRISDALGLDPGPKRDAVRGLYAARWRDRAGPAAKGAAPRPPADAGARDALAQNGAQTRVAARLRDLDAFRAAQAGDLGAGGARLAPAPANAAALALINQPGRPQGLRTGDVPAPVSVDALAPGTKALCPKDGLIATVFNNEKCSSKGTPNRESAEGTKADICRYMGLAGYDPDKAYALALAARKKPDADPGDLDLRNTEHYLYAYTTAAHPAGVGDTAPVQALLAVGWTPFKTITKYVRPTSTPSLEEMEWGVKGAYHGVSAPDWRRECGGGSVSL